MSKIILFLLCALFLSANVFAQNTSDYVSAARAFIDSLAKKDFAKAYDYFGDELKAKFPAEGMPQIWAQITGEYGQFQKPSDVIKSADDKKLVLVGEFEKATVGFSIIFDDKGKIVSFTLDEAHTTVKNAAKYEAPNYVDANSFNENEITVGAGTEWALPGTLTMPKDKTKVPAVVLVHGSGPGDRDETATNRANKIFKDLAWALASKGIAVLRYDKRTLVHGRKIVASKQPLTVNQETIDDAVAAVQLLRNTANVDQKNIYVLGHSLGGYLLPRIAQRDGQIAGFISLAGAVQPLEDVILEQNIYFASLKGEISKEDQTAINGVKEIVTKIKNLKASDAVSNEIILGVPASYWFDLQNYRPLEIAKTLKQPTLILQGESDFQVSMKDFRMAQAALGRRKNVTLKSYPNLTHFFMERTDSGKPSMADYEKTNHVKEIVINDIAAWILKNARK